MSVYPSVTRPCSIKTAKTVHKQRHAIARGFCFYGAKDLHEIPMESPKWGAKYKCGRKICDFRLITRYRPILKMVHDSRTVFSELTFTFAICCRPSVCLSSVCRLSVCLSVCNVRAPYLGGSNFRQYFYGIRYIGHPLTSTENFTEIVPGELLRRGS